MMAAFMTVLLSFSLGIAFGSWQESLYAGLFAVQTALLAANLVLLAKK